MKDFNSLAFATRLKNKRKEYDLTTIELGKRVGISDATISRYENCQREPSLANAAKLAHYFNVSISWLAGQDTNTEEEYLLNLYRELTEENKKLIVNMTEYYKNREAEKNE